MAIVSLTSERDRNGAVVDGDDGFDGVQLVASAIIAPTRANVARAERCSVSEFGILRQSDKPRTAVGVQTPRRRERRADASQAINCDERFVELSKKQALAFVRRARRMCWIDAIGQADRFNGFTCR